MYLKIENPGGTSVEYYASEGSDGTGLTPTAVGGDSYVSSITYDRDTGSPDANSIQIVWHITMGWNWTENTNIEYGVKASDDPGDSSLYNMTNGDYLYENDLTYTGSLVVTGATTGVLSSGSWVRGSESISWTGLKVVYQGTTTVYPSDSDFDVTISDDDTGSWVDSSSSGRGISITSQADASTDTSDVHNIRITGIPTGGSSVGDSTFTIKVDTTAPSVPGTPTVTIDGNKVPTASWAASSDSGVGLATSDTYELQWCADSGYTGCSSNVVNVTSTSYTFAGSFGDGTWYFRERAKDQFDNQ